MGEENENPFHFDGELLPDHELMNKIKDVPENACEKLSVISSETFDDALSNFDKDNMYAGKEIEIHLVFKPSTVLPRDFLVLAGPNQYRLRSLMANRGLYILIKFGTVIPEW